MPLVIEEDHRLLTGFDPQTASTLFWKDIPVVLRQPDREDQHEKLTFRILSGSTRQNHSLRILRVHISSEDDPYFLHTLEVSEEEFQSLKAEQGILVDFANFPTKLISLLEKCLSSQASDMPRFQAVLSTHTSDSTFRVIETNDFKQLPHITLMFKPGNDFAVKQFLAFRLGEVKQEYETSSSSLDHTQAQLAACSHDLSEVRQQLAALQQEHSRALLEADAKLKEQAAGLQQERLQEVSDLKAAHDKALDEAEGRAREASEALSARIAELDAENRALRNQKFQLDTQVSELSHQLAAAQGSNSSLQQEAESLRAQSRQLSSDKHQLDMQVNALKTKQAVLEDKATSQQQVIQQQQARLADLEASAKQWEARCSDLRDMAAGHEARAREAASEVLKGNQIIERLQTDLRLLKEKVKRKQAILVRQEEEVAAKEAALAAAQRDIAAAQAGAETLSQQIRHLGAENDELRDKLEESKQQLQSNEQMIRWLNQQVTDAQLQVSAVPGSRFQFRPSTTALSTPSLGAPGLPGLGGGMGGPGSYTSRLQGTSLGSKPPGSAGGGSARGPHTTLSFTPKTVTPLAGAGPRLGADQGVPAPLSSAISA